MIGIYFLVKGSIMLSWVHITYLGSISWTDELLIRFGCQREVGVVALYKPTELIKLTVGWKCYRDTNPVLASLMSDALKTIPLRPQDF